MTQDELNARLDDHKLWLSDNVQYEGKRFVMDGYTFDGLVFDDEPVPAMKLTNCTFNNCSFLRTIISKGKFDGSVFNNCAMDYARANYASLYGCTLNDCTITYMEFMFANLEQCSFGTAEFNCVVGDDVYIKSLRADPYTITYLADGRIYANCQKKTMAEWEAMTNEDLIAVDGDSAVKAYYKWLGHAKVTIAAYPAKPFDR